MWLLAGPRKCNWPSVTIRSVFQNPVTNVICCSAIVILKSISYCQYVLFLILDSRSDLQKKTDVLQLSLSKKEVSEIENGSEDALSISLPPTKLTAWSRIFGDGPEEMPLPANITMQDKITKDIENYFQLPVFDIDESPLNWWRTEEAKFSLLAKMAKKYLCVSATSVASE